MYYVYILKSQKNGRMYTGSTSDVNRRLVQHNSGRSKSTKYLRPFVLLYTESYATRSKAYQREMYFKTGKGREELSNIFANQNQMMGL